MDTTNEEKKREQLLKAITQLYRLVVVLFFAVLIMPVAYYFFKTFVKNVKDRTPHHKNIPATAYCCWQGSGVGQEAKLSLWAEFWPFPW